MGTRLDAIRRRGEDAFGSPLSRETLDGFVARLGRFGLPESAGPQAAARPKPSRRVRGNLLYLRFKAFDPGRLFDRWVGRLRFSFSRPFVFVSASLIALAMAITVSNGEEIGRDLHRLYRFQGLALVCLTVPAVTWAHEVAHGLTCKQFGGQVHEMGFMLLYFEPALYCNVSDAGLFPKKFQRLWVTFAGAYFELFLWGLATIAWRMTDPDTRVTFMALVVMATSAIKTFFNLNPLLKLDGYYLLSDALEIPNLRAVVFSSPPFVLLWAAGFPGPAARRTVGS